jgi:DNA (cytosine-5)-methyltransferase 1
LFVHFFRLVAEIRPAFFLVENVPGILANEHAEVLQKGLDKLPSSYKTLEPFSVRASTYGAPTSRTRVFMFGFDPSKVAPMRAQSFAPAEAIDVRVKDALRGLPEVSADWQSELDSWRSVGQLPKTWFGLRAHGMVPQGVGDAAALREFASNRVVSGFLGTRHSRETVRRFNALAPGQRDSISKAARLDWNGYCPTLRAGTGPDRGSYQAVRPIHPSFPRVITPREAARLQGFPDWFVLHPTKWHAFRHIGNSVSPIVAEALLSRIRKKLK